MKHQSNSNLVCFTCVELEIGMAVWNGIRSITNYYVFYGPIYPDIVISIRRREMLYTYWAYSLIGERANLNRCRKHQRKLSVCLRTFLFFCRPLIRISIAHTMCTDRYVFIAWAFDVLVPKRRKSLQFNLIGLDLANWEWIQQKT